ncbi:MAG TPA: hypothetical protein QGH56_03260 [Candidatus Marinimicrobia bacterium]|nr:hypothetical protein [Candidatus Neomarinimicrobiota bacterium]
MSKWSKQSFISDLEEKGSREVVKTTRKIIDFSEKHSENLSWGRGEDHGTMTFRCMSDMGLLPLFHINSDGNINLQINFLRNKNIPKMVLRDMVVKLESNLLREYDTEMYPIDSFEPVEDLFNTKSQVIKFLKTIEGCVYRLKQ